MIRTLPAVALCLVAGVSLLFFGVPATVGAFLGISAERVMGKIQDGRPVSLEELSQTISSQRQSLDWDETGRKWTDLALAQFLLAEKVEDDIETSQNLIAEGRTSLRNGLALAPANPFAWTRLAYVEFLRSGPSASVVPPLRMAISTARYEPRLLFPRLELCFSVWSHLEPKDRDVVIRQVLFAWRYDADGLVILAREYRQLELVRSILSQTPEEVARFDALLQQPPS